MGVGTLDLFIPLTLARCMRITSRKGSRLMYQPGAAPPGMVGSVPGALASLRWTAEAAVATWPVATWVTVAPRFVSDRFFFTASVAGTKGSHSSAMRLDWR